MNTYLITKWFGCFLINEDKKIIKKHVFSKNKESLLVKLKKIKNNQVLEEEKIITNDYFPIVAEKRLQQLGSYQPYNNFFLQYQINHNAYGFAIDFLYILIYLRFVLLLLQDSLIHPLFLLCSHQI